MQQEDKSIANQSGQAGRAAGSESTQQRGNPVSTTVEADYWRTNYQHRPYVEPGATYEQYAPAYRYGAEMCAIYSPQGRSFDEVEPELSRNWDTKRAGSRLTWEKAKDAVRDAWGRVAGTRSRAPAPPASTQPDETKVVPLLRKLHHITMDGVKGFREAADKVGPQYADLFRRLADEREQIDRELREQIALRGGDPDQAGDTLGALHRGWIDLKSALGGGTKAIIDECERGEDAAVKTYQEVLNEQGLAPDIEILLNRHYARVKNSHDQISSIKHALEKAG